MVSNYSVPISCGDYPPTDYSSKRPSSRENNNYDSSENPTKTHSATEPIGRGFEPNGTETNTKDGPIHGDEERDTNRDSECSRNRLDMDGHVSYFNGVDASRKEEGEINCHSDEDYPIDVSTPGKLLEFVLKFI